MKILKEETIDKESLPISFVTDLVSKGWDEVGYLKDAASAINNDFSNTDKITQLMQDLMDAYLVFIGQLEMYLHDEADMVAGEPEVAAEDKTTSAAKDFKKASEDTNEKEDEDNDEDDDEDDNEEDEDTIEISNEVEVDDAFERISKDIELPAAKINKDELSIEKSPDISNAFEFFVDFDEPDLSEPRLSDEDLYGEKDSEYEYNKLRSQING